MTKRTLLTAVIALAVLGAIFGYKILSIRRQMAAHAALVVPPATVSAAAVTEQTWPNSLVAVGSLASYRGVIVRNELEGLVREVVAVSGATVSLGDALVVLDTDSEQAQLRGLEAQLRLSELNLVRARELRTSDTNTENDLDTAEATAAQARAAVEQLRVTIAKKRIVAPFAGRLGIVQVHPGQVLAKSEALVVLESIDPIHLDFSLPQQDLARVATGQEVRFAVDAFPGRTFTATITAISPRVTDATRTVDLRATLANTDAVLRPGMYARAEVVLPSTPKAKVLPAAAIVRNPYGDTVYVITDSVVQQRFVKTGPQRGDLLQILDGLEAGERVVTSGQIKLRNGSAVRIDNSTAPAADPAPKPSES
ncbi:MAG TPA: efflux RND transporter periplasmic adaptor subunit [Opitutaceae bacterium]|nr:efflux RND transporter periplasmic adaptor subunit [Opitutaceae bacterium]